MAIKDFRQIHWDEDVADDCRQLVRLAVREDLDRWHDWTTAALVPRESAASATVVCRHDGIVAGLPACALTLGEYDPRLEWQPLVEDGAVVSAGQAIANVLGPARSLLAAERPLLNLLGHLSGIATFTKAFVEAAAGTGAAIYDTRKTTPGWRRLEKYAVRLGGGRNHRLGLYDAVLIKDNHLALIAACGLQWGPAEAVVRVRSFLAELPLDDPRRSMLIEIELDTLAQFTEVLSAEPDIVLLDNMPPVELRRAVQTRNAIRPQTQLEASGGITLSTIGDVARTGVERISVGALTHSAQWLDVGLDWR